MTLDFQSEQVNITVNLDFQKSGEITRLVDLITEKLPLFQSYDREQRAPHLWTRNRIDNIHATMLLEDWELDREHVEAVCEDYIVRGPLHLLQRAARISRIYKNAKNFNPFSKESLISAHTQVAGGIDVETTKSLWEQLDSKYPDETTAQPGKFRDGMNWIIYGRKIIGDAPPPETIPQVLDNLFEKLSDENEPVLIRAALVHCTLQNLAPFRYYNGILGRFWQYLLLQRASPVFDFVPLEPLTWKARRDYVESLFASAKTGRPEPFLKYMLLVIHSSLNNLTLPANHRENDWVRIHNFYKLGIDEFTRKDYMKAVGRISTSTASRDLTKGVDFGFFSRTGTKNATIYRCLRANHQKEA